MFARPFIDSVDFARNGRSISGEVPLASLSRLGDVLVDSEGVLAYTVRGAQAERDNLLALEIHGVCRLRCQRCLGEFSFPVAITSHLRLLDVGETDEFDDADDEVDCIEASKQLDVLELIEDEVLLGLPFAPKHPEGACVAGPEGLQRSANPFAALASLKKKQN
jgi:uncharacterized protein